MEDCFQRSHLDIMSISLDPLDNYCTSCVSGLKANSFVFVKLDDILIFFSLKRNMSPMSGWDVREQRKSVTSLLHG